MSSFKPYIVVNNPAYVYTSNSGSSKIVNVYNVGSELEVAYENDGWLRLSNGFWIMNSTNVVYNKDKEKEAEKNALLKSIYGSQKSSKKLFSKLAKISSANTMIIETDYASSTENDPDATSSSQNNSDDTGIKESEGDGNTSNSDSKDQKVSEPTKEQSDLLSQIKDILSGGDGDLDTDTSTTIGNYTIENMRGVFGIPYQFSSLVDPRVLVTSDNGFVSADEKFGRKYTEKILTRSPLLILQAGNPNFLDDYSTVDKYQATAGLDLELLGSSSGDSSSSLKDRISKMASGSGRYYSFKGAPVDYFNAVNDMCRSMAALLDLRDASIYGKDYSSFDWSDTSIGWSKKSYSGSVAFYVNSEAQVTESFSNGTRDSQLVSQINQISDMAAEVQFLMGSTTASTKIQSVQDAAKQTSQEVVTKKDGAAGNTSMTGLLGSLMNNLDTLMSGGKMVFPQLWQDSQYTKNYSITLKFDTPDADKLSIYLNILVPLAHVLAFAMPRKAGDNGYVSPFIVRAYYKSMFHIDLGMITNCNIVRGDVQAWNQDGLPTQVTVQLDIKDLYNVMSMAAGTGINDVIGNPSQLDYIANLCGINIEYPDIRRTFRLWRAIRVHNGLSDYFNRTNNNVIQFITRKWTNLGNYWKI